MLQSEYPSLCGKHVLLVEANDALYGALRSLLEDAGCDLFGWTELSVEALEVIAGQQIDVALIDFKRNGQLFFCLAQQLSERSIPIVLIANEVATELPLQLQSREPLRKPFIEQELLDRIVEAVGTSQATRM
jgi:CheY-like chemotaxis protein